MSDVPEQRPSSDAGATDAPAAPSSAPAPAEGTGGSPRVSAGKSVSAASASGATRKGASAKSAGAKNPSGKSTSGKSAPKRNGTTGTATGRARTKLAAENAAETTVAAGSGGRTGVPADGASAPVPDGTSAGDGPVAVGGSGSTSGHDREAVADPGPTQTALLPPPIAVKAPRAAKPRVKKATARLVAPTRELGEVVLSIQGLTKRFGQTVAVDNVDLQVRQGSFYGIVGPNGAGKTTTLSMVTGLLRPDAGSVTVHGIDVWGEPVRAKRTIGVLPDTLRLFDRLTGAQLLYYAGTLRGLDAETVRQRSADLVSAFAMEDAVDRLVADYSAGMTKKIALAAAMIHSPRLLVLDEPFESVDPVSAANLNEILQKYVAAGGTVVLSSHGMDFIQRVCDHVAIIVAGRVLSAGTMDEVRGEQTLEDRFVELAGGRKAAAGMEWLHHFSD